MTNTFLIPSHVIFSKCTVFIRSVHGLILGKKSIDLNNKFYFGSVLL